MKRYLTRIWCSWFGSCGSFTKDRCYCDRGEELHLAARSDTEHDSLRGAKKLTITPPISQKEVEWEELKGNVYGEGFDEDITEEC